MNLFIAIKTKSFITKAPTPTKQAKPKYTFKLVTNIEIIVQYKIKAPDPIFPAYKRCTPKIPKNQHNNKVVSQFFAGTLTFSSFVICPYTNILLNYQKFVNILS